MTESAYRNAIHLNEEIVSAIRAYKSGSEPKKLITIYTQLQNVTDQEIRRVMEKLCLSLDVFEDMRQDAWFKLGEAIGNYNEERCPVFLGFWRKVLSNHLLSSWHSKWRPVELLEEAETRKGSATDKLLLKLLVEELRSEYLFVFQEDAIAIDILQFRLFVDPDARILQKTIACSYAVTQGYVSRWEAWLKHRIREDHPELTI